MSDTALDILRELVAGADDHRCWHIPAELNGRIRSLLDQQRPETRVWTDADFEKLEQDDPPTQKLPDTDLMCGRVRRWVWKVSSTLTLTRVWRESAERGIWKEAKE